MSSTWFDSPAFADCRCALALAFVEVDRHASGADWVLVSAIAHVAHPMSWRLGFKAAGAIPRYADGVMGAGGELFVDVDADGHVRVRYGE